MQLEYEIMLFGQSSMISCAGLMFMAAASDRYLRVLDREKCFWSKREKKRK